MAIGVLNYYVHKEGPQFLNRKLARVPEVGTSSKHFDDWNPISLGFFFFFLLPLEARKKTSKQYEQSGSKRNQSKSQFCSSRHNPVPKKLGERLAQFQ